MKRGRRRPSSQEQTPRQALQSKQLTNSCGNSACWVARRRRRRRPPPPPAAAAFSHEQRRQHGIMTRPFLVMHHFSCETTWAFLSPRLRSGSERAGRCPSLRRQGGRERVLVVGLHHEGTGEERGQRTRATARLPSWVLNQRSRSGRCTAAKPKHVGRSDGPRARGDRHG